MCVYTGLRIWLFGLLVIEGSGPSEGYSSASLAPSSPFINPF